MSDKASNVQISPFREVMKLAELTYHEKSLKKWPTWEGLPETEQIGAICDELSEVLSANDNNEIHGPHGEKAELLDLIVVAARRYMELEGHNHANAR